MAHMAAASPSSDDLSVIYFEADEAQTSASCAAAVHLTSYPRLATMVL